MLSAFRQPAPPLFSRPAPAGGSVSRSALLCVALAALMLGACGRQERTISITSEPPGALVWLNDVELGRTPVETDFKFFGVYDVRLALAGYEPLITSREAQAPFYEQPGIDLVAAAIPGTRRTKIDWHFDLALLPTDEAGKRAAETGLVERARALRTQSQAAE